MEADEVASDEAGALPQATDSESTAIDPPPSAETNVRRRRPGRVRLDGLGHLAISEEPQNQQLLEIIREIDCQLIWINAIGLKTLLDGRDGFPRVNSQRHVQYERLLTRQEVSFGDADEDLYESRMQSRILEHIATLTFDEAMAFVMDHRPSQFYSEIFRVQVMKFCASKRAIIAADRSPDMEIPQSYSWCNSKYEYLDQLTIELEKNRQYLTLSLKILQALLKLIRRGAKLSLLTSEHLNALKVKMEAFEGSYATACFEVDGGAVFEKYLISPKSERWWETDDNVTEAYPKGMQSSLNFIIPTISLLSVIPAVLAWRHDATERGSVTDSDFYQSIAGSTLQLLGLITFIWPTLSHPRLSHLTWFWIWILAGFSAICALLSVPLYLLLATSWSFIIAYGGAIAQVLVQLQVINSI